MHRLQSLTILENAPVATIEGRDTVRRLWGDIPQIAPLNQAPTDHVHVSLADFTEREKVDAQFLGQSVDYLNSDVLALLNVGG